MAPAQKFQWLFAILMGSAMVFGVTFAVTAFNTGFDAGFPLRWLRSFLVGWCVAVPMIYFLAPRASRAQADRPPVGHAGLSPATLT